MKTYYAVTEGEYSDYRIITITEDKEKAERIAAAYDGDVEEYEDCIINLIGVGGFITTKKLKSGLYGILIETSKISKMKSGDLIILSPPFQWE